MARLKAPLLGTRLRETRRRTFSGRAGEIELFRSAVLAPDGPASVLFLHGPGGVGKSSVLDVLTDVAAADGATPIRVDGRDVPPDSSALLGALAAVLSESSDDPLASLADVSRPVVLLDTYELLAPLDNWVREEFLPALPGDAVVVIAGRQPPAPSWLADPAWRELLRVVSLRNLPPQDGRAYLAAQDIPEALHEQLLSISYGHPLTLSMLVDSARRRAAAGGDPATAVPRSLSDVPDLVRVLLTHAIEEAPGPRHRMALEVCAHAHITEDLLRAVLGGSAAEAGELFAWLRTQSFVEEGPYGLFPHDLARDALDADLRWRDPDRYAELHHTVRAHVHTRIRSAGDEREKQRLMTDAIFLACPRIRLAVHVATARPVKEHIDQLRDGDRAAVIEMTAALQGREQAELVAYWMRRQPSAFRVFRGARGEPQGYGACLELHDATEADLAEDPGAAAMWRYAQRHGPSRAGEQVLAWRFFLDGAHHHDSSPSLTLFAAWQALDILGRDRVAWSLVGTYTDAELWSPTLEYLDFWRAGDADYDIGGTRYVVFAHDWRRTGVPEWLELTAAREVGAPARSAGEHTLELVLSQPEFADAVRAALRDLHVPDQLRRNPLLRSQVVRRHTRDGQPAADALHELLGMAAETLRADQRHGDLHAVADRTFLRPAATQERIAEALHLSFSTYRRHRDRAVARIVEWMWEHEIYGPDHERGHRMNTG
ncbi:ATP-binding protein [Amycolatopsis balhimycina DSM 5908]|uniref:ATP-binding protein n=1 Tax=Amycolatopsis balhimycina DSM 5908 TaxID=1081091 RepID=A0A428WP95_AMYBA|nr:ATP-binding protein [Amycolatopsis balhimycina]RSM44925.1 ATP-binding protein [Amycolatopsis balhimycina DSM 5908]